MGALEDWCVHVYGEECGRLSESTLIADMRDKHCPGRDVAWNELKRRATLEENWDRLAELEQEE